MKKLIAGAAMALMLPMGQILFPPQPELVAPGDLLPLTSSDPDPPGVIIGNRPDKQSNQPDETTPDNATMPSSEDLKKLRQWVESDQLKPLIQKIFPMSKVARAHAESEAGHVVGKLVLDMQPQSS